MDSTIGLILFLCVNCALALILGFLFGKTRVLNPENEKLPKWLKWVVGIIVFGGLSIVCHMLGVTYDGIVLNARDLGPIVSGLWFGPVIGIGSAIVGAAFRMTAGGVTLIPCTIATLLAGIIAAGVFLWLKRKGKEAGILIAGVLALAVEVVHLLLVALIVPGGAAIAFGPAGLGTLASVLVMTLLYAAAYKAAGKMG